MSPLRPGKDAPAGAGAATRVAAETTTAATEPNFALMVPPPPEDDVASPPGDLTPSSQAASMRQIRRIKATAMRHVRSSNRREGAEPTRPAGPLPAATTPAPAHPAVQPAIANAARM